MIRALALLPLLLVACGTDDTDDTTGDTDVAALPPQEQPLKVAPTGDFTCVTPAAAFADVVWNDQGAPDAAGLPTNTTVDVLVQDFEHEEPVAGRITQLWFDDVAEGPADTNGTTDENGHVTLTGPACTPLSYLTKQFEGLEEAKDTYKAHMIVGPEQTDATFESVSISTYRLIPTVLGLSVDANKGIIAGTAYDCSRDPALPTTDDTGKMQNVRTRISSCPSATSAPADCTGTVDGAVVKYFIDKFPSRDQGSTSPDGLWGFFNVPAGTFRVDAYGLIDGEEKVFGATIVTVYPDSINIGNIWAGHEDGVKYPTSCFENSGDTDVDTDIDPDTDADTDN